jgi:HD-GYP domain-containing protein (c-di-GMP phosphodiesterase class II)
MATVATTTNDGYSSREELFQRLIGMGIALSSERNTERLMELILLEAKDIANADGGTLYLMDEEQDALRFAIMHNDSLNIAMGGTTGIEIPFPPLQLINQDTGEPNYANNATAVALRKKSINIPDAYDADEFDFSGTKAFDTRTGYRSMSFFTVPLINNSGSIIGVLQLINSRSKSGRVVAFSEELQPLIEALASQAAVALENSNLVRQQRELLESFIELIASAIDAKSPYTGGHCSRVPIITKMLAEAACDIEDGEYKEFQLSEEQWYELHLAAWLHDCGKVTTPEYVVDKATKLETIYDRIHEIRMRFEILRRDAEIAYLRKCQVDGADETVLRTEFESQCAQLTEEFEFIAAHNIGGEFMPDEDIVRMEEIGDRTWHRYFDNTLGVSWEESQRIGETKTLPVEERLLADRPEHLVAEYNRGERYNLAVKRGTLNEEERKKINDHITITIEMLEQLPFPKHLRNVPEYAGGHHEKMDGTGYPRGLKGAEMSIPARMMAIADIFEALTATDRPYKKAKKLSEALFIMKMMTKDQHIDSHLFELFLREGVYQRYAEEYLDLSQIDDVDINEYLPE